jgi:hypothetical protein
MREQMRRVASEDQEFQRALVKFVKLKEALDGAVRTPSRTTAVQRTAAKGALPFDAAFAADVRMGRGPWRHALKHRTFTFAEVHGEVQKLEIACADRTEEPRYEEGAEWTLPPGWQRCSLSVEAPRGTTFTLYEFE